MNQRLMHLKVGFKKNGLITAIDDFSIADSGVRGSSIFGNTMDQTYGPYFTTRCLNVKQSMDIVDSNRGMMYLSGQHNPMNWDALMAMAEKKAARFMGPMTCTNIADPCGMGLWEGVPLREVIWLARPVENVRRVFYYGYHNDDPKQRFQSSLANGRVLEDPPGAHPVILCYKMNGQWLSPDRGGPVRMVVPGAYANKYVKWLQRIVLTNNYQANDTYAQWNNDTESPLKTYARFVLVPKTAPAGQPVPVTGLAQVGMSGLAKVQYWICPKDAPLPKDDPYFTSADWRDAAILPPPQNWGGGLPGGKLPPTTRQTDPTGKPHEWPMRNTLARWAALIDGLAPGQYHLRCRTVDANGVPQPMPRPFLKSGHNDILQVELIVGS
jgi:hypothetical protein